MMPKIFLFAQSVRGDVSGPANPSLGVEFYPGEAHGMAMAEDGRCLAGHLSSNIEWLRHDLTSPYKRTKYAEHYPDGYELEWVDEPKTHPGLQAAYALNQQFAEAETATAS